MQAGIAERYSMSIQTLKLGKREFVVLPKREYERLVGKPAKRAKPARTPRLSNQDRGDIAEDQDKRLFVETDQCFP